jgi:hypothetical protein
MLFSLSGLVFYSSNVAVSYFDDILVECPRLGVNNLICRAAGNVREDHPNAELH